jgi:uncharacterized protein YbjT (DUF2867 family)
MTHHEDKTTLILGGTGKTGSRVARRLEVKGVPVRVASRSGAPAFDWDDETTWPRALEDVGAVYIAYYPDLVVPGAAAKVRAFTGAAVRSGVRKLVLLAGRGEPQTEPSEAAVRDSGVPFTIIKAAWFAQNFSESFLLEPVLSGEVAFPAGNVAEPFVDVEDIAEIAALALTTSAHDGRTYDVTGPRLLTFAEAVRAIASASGRAVSYIPVTHAEYAAVLRSTAPPEFHFLAELFEYLLDGHNANVGDGVERALGRKARDFADYARDAARAGAWA